MTKDKFIEFFNYINSYKFKEDVKYIKPKVTLAETRITLNLYMIDEYVDYGDFTHEEFKSVFKEVLMDDDFIDKKKNPLDSVESIERWEVWLNLTDGDSFYSGVHLFDYSNEGLKIVRK